MLRTYKKLSLMGEKLTEILESTWAGCKLQVLSGYRLLLPAVVLKCVAAVFSPVTSPKLKQVSNEFVVFYSKENNAWIGGVQCVTSSGALYSGILDKSWFYR